MSEQNDSTNTSGNRNSGLSLKDALTPLSIVAAGLFVGAGLYFSNASPAENSGTNQVAQVPQKEEDVDMTSKVAPVTADDHIKGSLSAPVKIVEYSDFDCPFCHRFHDVMNAVVKKYSGDEVAWVYRQFPLEQLHPQAPAVALASECVAELGGNEAFWKFADGYQKARGEGDKSAHSELIPKMAVASGVSKESFTECFDSGRLKPLVDADINQAVETGGRGTPWSIIIGPTGKTYPINGALPQSAVEQLIETARKEA